MGSLAMAGRWASQNEILDDYPYLESERLQGRIRVRGSDRESKSDGALKLLFDANLSPKLVTRLADLFPASE